jgi:hypothetical protein
MEKERDLFIRLHELNEKLDNNNKLLNEKLDNNNKLLNEVLKILNNDVKNNCQKMNEHIDFVENVYDVVKSPLNYICNSINSNRDLPSNEKQLEIKNEELK